MSNITKASIVALAKKIMKPIAKELVDNYATKTELEDAIDEVENSSFVKDVPVSVEGEMLVFEATAEAEIDGEMLIIDEVLLNE